MKPVCFVFTLFLVSCGGDSAEQGGQVIDGTDTITEFDMNEPRLTAVEFNNEMTFMQDAVLSQIDELFNSDSSNIDLNLENTLFELELNIESLKNIKAPEKSESFVTAMKKLMEFYRSELTGPFQTIVPLVKKTEWSKADEKAVNEYDLNFVAQEKAWFDTVFAAQESFAKANNIKLSDEY